MLCGLLGCIPVFTRAQKAAPAASSPVEKLAGLLARHKSHVLSDTAYLKGVDSIAPLLMDDDSLKYRLSPYQQIAFNDRIPARFRMHYYWFLALQAVSKNRYGSAIYYSEKNNAEGVKGGIFQKDTIQHSDLFAISVYCTDRDFTRAIAKYRALKPGIVAVARGSAFGKPDGEQVFVAISILDEAALAGEETNDTALLREAEALSGQMRSGAAGFPKKYTSYQTFYDCTYHIIQFLRRKQAKQRDSAEAVLRVAIREAGSPGYIPHLQPYTLYDTYGYAFDFYFDGGQVDSAQRFLDRVRDLQLGMLEHSDMKQSFLLDGGSKVEASRGEYEAAYRDLRKAYQIEDSSVATFSSDKDDNLYALAEAENAKFELMHAEKKRREAEQFTILLVFLLAFIVLTAVSGYFIFRSRSKQRILQLRLGLARNFHDEIGPMLLFAGTLLKKEAQTRPSPGLDELRSHMAVIMEAVRGIAHDLKEGEIATIATFGKEVTLLLEKVRNATGTDFTFRMDNETRILSHFQHTHLRKIMNELIGNSIKHSGCHSIHVTALVRGGRLDIRYSDDGPGMAPSAKAGPEGGATGGIGLQNIRERVVLLNGTFCLNNAYPRGYSIDIQIPLP